MMNCCVLSLMVMKSKEQLLTFLTKKYYIYIYIHMIHTYINTNTNTCSCFSGLTKLKRT